MDPNLILRAAQPADILGSMSNGNALAGQVNEQWRQNALTEYTQKNGAGIMAGDTNALAGLAGFDPQMAFNMGIARQNNERANAQLALQRERYGQQDRQWQQTFDYNQGRDARQDQRADEEWRWKLDEHAAKLTQEQREAQAAEVEKGVRMGMAARTPQEWDQIMGTVEPSLVGAFDQREAVAARYMTMAEVLKGQRGASPGGVEFGLAPVYGTDTQGNTVLMQLGKDGSAVSTKLPDGVTPNLSVKTEEAARGTARGKAMGEAEAALPGAYTEAQHVISMVDALANDAYLPEMVGPINARLPNTSADAARVQSRMDQVQGQGFMAARQFLKGQGQITDFESRRAEAAMARMSAAQRYEDYQEALAEFKDAVQVGILKAEAAAGRGQQAAATPAPAAPPPPPGQAQQPQPAAVSDDDLLKKYGG